MYTAILLVSAVFGLIFGSFAGATVWRVRARQLIEDKKAGESVDPDELKRLRPLAKETVSKDRSRCLDCGHTLEWYDLVPILSWVSTKGRCRYCKEPIGYFEPLIEIGTALLFVGIVSMFAMDGITATTLTPLWLILWPVATVLLVMLFVYDLKWYLLPNLFMFPLIGVSIVIAVLKLIGESNITLGILNIIASLVILSGLYAALYWYSRWRYGEDRTWVGYGDVKLGVALGLLLSSWELAFLTLFLANFIGVVLLLPGLLTRKVAMTSRIPLGPLLILGFFLSFFFGAALLDGYQALSLKLSDLLVSLML